MEFYQQEGLWHLGFQEMCLRDFYHYFELEHIMGWIMSLSKFLCWSPNPPAPQNMTFFGDRVFTEAVSYSEVVRVSPSPCDWYLYKKKFGCRHAYRENAREHEDSQPQAKGRGLEQILPLQPSEGTSPADTWRLDFQPPGLRDKSFLLFKSFVCDTRYSSLGKPIPQMQSGQRWELGEADQTSYSFFISLRRLSNVSLSYLRVGAPSAKMGLRKSFNCSCLSFSPHVADYRNCGLKSMIVTVIVKAKGDHTDIWVWGRKIKPTLWSLFNKHTENGWLGKQTLTSLVSHWSRGLPTWSSQNQLCLGLWNI